MFALQLTHLVCCLALEVENFLGHEVKQVKSKAHLDSSKRVQNFCGMSRMVCRYLKINKPIYQEKAYLAITLHCNPYLLLNAKWFLALYNIRTFLLCPCLHSKNTRTKMKLLLWLIYRCSFFLRFRLAWTICSFIFSKFWLKLKGQSHSLVILFVVVFIARIKSYKNELDVHELTSQDHVTKTQEIQNVFSSKLKFRFGGKKSFMEISIIFLKWALFFT